MSNIWQKKAILNNSHLSKFVKTKLKQDIENQSQLTSRHKHGTAVYYLSKYIKSNFINRCLTKTPQICLSADNYIQLQNKEEYKSYADALEAQPDLLTYEERMRARRKIIITDSLIFAQGGYHSDFKNLSTPMEAIILSAAGAQLDVEELDYTLYCNPKNGSLKVKAFQSSMNDDVYLWLHALEDYMINHHPDRMMHLRIPGIGAGWFAKTPNGTDLGSQVKQCIINAFGLHLSKEHFPHLEHFEFLYYEEDELDEKSVTALHEAVPTSFSFTDICAPLPAKHSHRILGMINPSDTFGQVANEFGYESLEAMIGNNSSLRFDQSYLFNPELLKSANHIAIHMDGGKSSNSQAKKSNAKPQKKIPIAESKSVSSEIRFVSYNTLTAIEGYEDDFQDTVDAKYRHWHHKSGTRKRLVKKAVVSKNLDLMCLVEVTEEMLEYIFDNTDEFEYVYCERIDDIMGSAIVYRKTRFQCLNQLHKQLLPGNAQVINSLLLQDLESDKLLCVTALHLKAGGEEYEPRRLQEMKAAVKYIEKFAKTKEIAHIISGDFNSNRLAYESLLYDFMVNDKGYDDFFAKYKKGKYWTYWYWEKAIFDYVFIRGDNISASKLLIPVSKHPSPNNEQGSDHLPLYCTFQIQ
jgi:endonuclease/exonuclease/phosphatase (EEP) superfamily protein YafD